MTNGMTNAEFNAFLETLAKLIEAKRKPLPRPPISFGKPRHKKKVATPTTETAT